MDDQSSAPTAVEVDSPDALLREALSVSPNHYAVYDVSDRLVAWSAGFERFHADVFSELRAEGCVDGVTVAELVRRQVSRRFPPERREAEIAQRLAAHRAADGEVVERFVPGVGWARLRKIRLPSGGVVTVGEDVTELKRETAAREEARREAERANALKSVFLSNVSHELRTPLNGVTGLAALLDGTSLDATQREYVRLIRESAASLLAMIEDLLEIGRIEADRVPLRREVFAPAEILRDVCVMTAATREEGLAVECDAQAGFPGQVRGDAERFRQIAWNLVGNAAKFARSRVSTRLDYIGRAGVGRMLLTVDDDGPGVPEAERDAVFERFERGGAEAGAGLGLAIARALVLRMGGAIGVSEGPLGGARFWVELPEDPAPLTGEAAGGDPAVREASR